MRYIYAELALKQDIEYMFYQLGQVGHLEAMEGCPVEAIGADGQ